MENVFLTPWVGKDYLLGIEGKRVMVLGESHYCAKPEQFTKDLTINIISDLLDPNSEHEHYKNTYTKFERALYGRIVEKSEKETLWNSILFYNFIQEPISGPRIKPSNEQIELSTIAFFEVLEKYRPDCVIVWGMSLYNFLPNVGNPSNEIVVYGEECKTLEYILSDDHSVKIMPIFHPSSGFAWEYWHKFIKEFINQK